MGNHDVGRAMHAAAQAYRLGLGGKNPSKDEALAMLDQAADLFRGADAEFDDYLRPGEPLWQLVTIAFGPWTDADQAADHDGEKWFDGPYSQFRARYRFC
jgi:hypothetical protein